MTKFITKKSLGQNFLVNKGIVAKIITAANVGADDTIIEVGPGRGALTESLLATGAKVICIEKDSRLIDYLKNKFAGLKFEIIEDDVLEIDIDRLNVAPGNYKIIANIPYYITSHFIRDIFEKWPRFKVAVIMVQKEVAARIAAKPGQMSILGLAVQYFSDIEIVATVSKGSFSPPPKIDSAVIKLTSKHDIPSKEIHDKFFKFIRAGFSQKRKKLISNLERELNIDKAQIETLFTGHGIDLKIRAEDLSLDQWLKMVNSIELSS